MTPSKIKRKMDQSIGMLSDGSDQQSSSTNNYNLEIDPLEEIGAEDALATKPKFYRMNSIVFAEPLKTTKKRENSTKETEDNNEIRILDNIIVHKDPGKKYKKYHFNIGDGSPTSCPQLNCNRTFKTKNRLIAHIRRVHCADRKKYICEQCGRGFPEQHMLRRHADTHSEDTVQCPICGVKLRLRTSLATHLRSHSNERPHQCEICKKTFTRASIKTNHVKFVHREGLLECDECDKRYVTVQLRHSHECDICKKKFTRASIKTNHVKFVHREGLLE